MMRLSALHRSLQLAGSYLGSLLGWTLFFNAVYNITPTLEHLVAILEGVRFRWVWRHALDATHTTRRHKLGEDSINIALCVLL